MIQPSEQCCELNEKLLSVYEAEQQIFQTYKNVALAESVALRDAENLVLAENVSSAVSVPSADNSAVDGYAFRFDDLDQTDPISSQPFTLQGRAAAGHPYNEVLQPHHAVRIFTGALIPSGADTVVMQEECHKVENKVFIPINIKKGRNFRKAGEDIKPGQIVLTKGSRLFPPHIGLAAAMGRSSLLCHRRLKIGIFSTGDEVAQSGSILKSGQIYDSNTPMLVALLKRLHSDVIEGGLLPDNKEAITHALHDMAQKCDLIITSGGVSVGEEDHVKDAVQSMGQLAFWRLAIKPGRPVAMGHIEQTPFIGLPGNPVAAFVTFTLMARPLIACLRGENWVPLPRFQVAAQFEHQKKAGRSEYMRIILKENGAHMIAEKFPREGSAILTSIANSQALAELPEELTEIRPGDMISCIPMELAYG